MKSALLGLVLTMPAAAAPLSIAVRLADQSAQLSQPAAVVITVTSADPAVATDRKPDVVTVKVPGFATLQLPPGIWQARTSAPALLDAEETISLPPGGASAAFELWQKAHFEGEVKSAEKPPETFVARWQHPGARVSGVSECRVTKKRFVCDVPAGTFDYRFRAVGFLTQYRWATEVKPGATRNIGLLQWVRGASVVGVATPARGAAIKQEETIVKLSPVDFTSGQHDESTAFTGRPNPKGFFELRGIPPGEYFIEASSGRLFSERRRILVRRNAETELTEPLVLSPPHSLRVTIRPPLDPALATWQVRVLRSTSGGSHRTAVHEAFADQDGSFVWPRLIPGAYAVEIASHKNRTYARREIETAAADYDLAVDVPLTRVHGVVRLAGKPLPSTVWLGGRSSGLGVDVQTDDDGAFATIAPLPDDETWPLTVESAKPPIQRTLSRRPKREDDGSALLEIDLGAGGIEGTVVDTAGVPVKRALIDLGSPDSAEGLIQAHVDEAGKFGLHGMAPGSYLLQARSFDGGQSDRTTVTLRDDDDVQFVTLTVKSVQTLTGRLMSAAGPVPGARVGAFPVGTHAVVTSVATTDAGGNFSIDLPPGTRVADVNVSPPGFALRMFRTEVRGETAIINVDQTSGTLRVTAPQFAEDERTAQGFILHDGAVLPMIVLMQARDARTAASARKDQLDVSIPLLEPGVYSLCIGSYGQWFAGQPFRAEQCTSGVLAPFGVLSLEPAAE
ncbi:MAG TPA: carboxypeptidase-like regulatory domain-containing protein [Thermoanaerobaculia bacterium]|jgi:hypothetical protein|nr:carboxypeptidase-like regulatory domain-containing protein [Thermoanaerobaculia bacterium]